MPPPPPPPPAAANAASWAGAPLGVPTALALLLYGLGRFGIEFLRNNDGRTVLPRLKGRAPFLKGTVPLPALPALSVNHLLSLVVLSLGALALPVLIWRWGAA